MKNKLLNSTKKAAFLLLATVMMLSTTFIASANTNAKKSTINRSEVISRAYTDSHKVFISSTAGKNTGSIRGSHTITYRAEKVKNSGVYVYKKTESFGGTGDIIIFTNLHLVDYAKGRHVYKFTGEGSFVVNTFAHN